MSDDGETPESAYAAPYARSAVELKATIEAERHGQPFVVWRGLDGKQRILQLFNTREITCGRGSSNEIVLHGDGEVSRVHARLELVGGNWVLEDDGLSRNGTYVNGSRLNQRRRLADGDLLRMGRTILEYRCPSQSATVATDAARDLPLVEKLTETQRRVVMALCRPYLAGQDYAAPATNQEIAAEVFLGVDAVKNHLRLLYQRFGIAELPQHQKRVRLVECAVELGLVAERGA